MAKQQIGKILLGKGIISEEQLSSALKLQKNVGKRLGALLVDLGLVNDDELSQAIAAQLVIPYIHLASIPISEEIIAEVPKELVVKHEIFPVCHQGKNLLLATSDPGNLKAQDEISFALGTKVTFGIAPKAEILKAIEKYYGAREEVLDLIDGLASADKVEFIRTGSSKDGQEDIPIQVLYKKIEAPPIIRLVNLIMAEAIKFGASDIHIAPMEDHCQVRYRVDGELRTGVRYPKQVHDAVVSRIKITSNLDITNRRLPQDGRTSIRTDSGTLDMRISVVPSSAGEKVVVRLLGRSDGIMPLDNLDMGPDIRARLLGLVESFHGMLLVTGPTGSGKTSSLYSLLDRIDGKKKNIVTIEDPIEYKLADATQIAVNDGIGLTFSHTLRAILRQDPDVIMVGEVRDGETAEIAARAAMTGHLVLTTVHTVDAVSALTRLLEIGLDGYLVASSVTYVLAQRLLRKICPACSKESGRVEFRLNGEAHSINPIYSGVGCDACGGTGYKGRKAVFELLTVDAEMRDLILHGAPESRLEVLGRKHGMIPMFEAGLRYVEEGITTADELVAKVPHRYGAGKFQMTLHP